MDHETILIFFKSARPQAFGKSHMMVPSKRAGKIYTGTDRLTNGGTRKIEPKAVNPFKRRGTVWRYAPSRSEGNRLKLRHPATYPDALAEDLIRCFTEPGATVLDPMCGSGTTAVMATKWSRSAVAFDISEEYTAIARERLEGCPSG